jgi:RNA polymerase sigma factor (TIGR02999 family)
MSDVTRILSASDQGDSQAPEQLLPLVYHDLRKLAAQWLAREKPGQTLQATALVHEAYLRLVDVEAAQRWDSRRHFFAAAAEAMRRILVENARAKKCLKRGRGLAKQEIEPDRLATPDVPEELLALDEALTRLRETDRQAAEVVQLRIFNGLTVKEAAEILGVSPRTVDSYWAYARAWLLAELHGGDR